MSPIKAELEFPGRAKIIMPDIVAGQQVAVVSLGKIYSVECLNDDSGGTVSAAEASNIKMGRGGEIVSPRPEELNFVVEKELVTGEVYDLKAMTPQGMATIHLRHERS